MDFDFIYFFVTGSKDWEPIYHQNFFFNQNGFTFGVLGALAIAFIAAIGFYFGCCNSSKSCSMANLGVWGVTLGICGLVAYFYADYVVIGAPKESNKESMFRKYSFYQANEDLYLIKIREEKISKTQIEDLARTKEEIRVKLNKGNDVRLPFNFTTTILAIVFYFLISIAIKRLTINGKCIPIEKP